MICSLHSILTDKNGIEMKYTSCAWTTRRHMVPLKVNFCIWVNRIKYIENDNRIIFIGWMKWICDKVQENIKSDPAKHKTTHDSYALNKWFMGINFCSWAHKRYCTHTQMLPKLALPFMYLFLFLNTCWHSLLFINSFNACRENENIFHSSTKAK